MIIHFLDYEENHFKFFQIFLDGKRAIDQSLYWCTTNAYLLYASWWDSPVHAFESNRFNTGNVHFYIII